MNLYEEIHKMLKKQSGFQTESVLAQALADLAKEWALEMVGEDLEIKGMGYLEKRNEAMNIDKQEIRQRIEGEK